MAEPRRGDGLRRLIGLDWDAIAGIIAAVAALVLHLLHVVDVEVLLVIAVVLLALLFIRDLRRERIVEEIHEEGRRQGADLERIRLLLRPPDVVLVGPSSIREDSEAFARRARGELVWFNVCLSMFRPQALFDTLLRPAVENPRVTSIRFVVDERQREIWDRDVLPKLALCAGREKVEEPRWTTIEESVSVIVSASSAAGTPECLLSFWGEPFMAHHASRDVPRYIFLVLGTSELLPRLTELERKYRL